MNSYKASIGNVMYVYQNKLTNLHLLFNCYRKEKMHRQLQKGILKATLNQYTIRQQWRFHGNADKAYNTLHFASKVVCQGASPFGNP